MQGSKRKDRTKLPCIRDDMLLIEKSRPKKLTGVMDSPLEELLDVGGTCLPLCRKVIPPIYFSMLIQLQDYHCGSPICGHRYLTTQLCHLKFLGDATWTDQK